MVMLFHYSLTIVWFDPLPVKLYILHCELSTEIMWTEFFIEIQKTKSMKSLLADYIKSNINGIMKAYAPY